MSDAPVDTVIIGAGIVGLSTALELLERGNRVALIDPDDPLGQASYGNAGVLNRGSIFPVAGPGLWARLPHYALGRDTAIRVRWTAFREFAPWLPRFLRAANESAWRTAAAALNPLVAASYDRHLEMAERVGIRHLIRRNGYMRVYRDGIGIAAGALERELLSEHGVAAEHVDERTLRELEPHLAPRFKAALLFADSASVESPGAIVAAYRAAALQRGARLIKGHALALEEGADTVTVHTAGGSIVAAHAVLSAGAWSGRFAARLGYHIPLAAERGYHVHLKPQGNAVLNRPVLDAAGAYVMAPMGETVRVLSGVELARPDDPPNHAQIRIVVADARRSLPFEPGPQEEIWMGSRPSTPDGLPVIGFPKASRRLLLAFGHGHIGFASGPATGQIAAQLLCGEMPAVPVAPFSPARFGV